MSQVHRGARGAIALDAAACTSCMLCVKECPDWCIHIDSHNEEVGEPSLAQGAGAAAPAGPRRQRSVAVLDSFTIDWGLCMYCGICVEVCPFDALHWVPTHDYPSSDQQGLRHGIEQLEKFGSAQR